MKVKFNSNTIVAKAIRKKGTTHEIPDDVAKHVIERGFGEAVAAAAPPAAPGAGEKDEATGGDAPEEAPKKGRKKKDADDGAGS